MQDIEFWTAREALKHIKDNSTANFCSPWHILALAIEGALQQVPYDVGVQTHRSRPLPLNFAAILYGRSSGSKSYAADLVNGLFDWVTPYHPHGVRSGEGIIDSYGAWDKNNFVWNTPSHAGAFTFDEITDFSAKADRAGSTMIGTVLSMVTGGLIGGVRAGGINSTLPAKSYRATLTIGGQPGRCSSLVSSDAVARGVGGRFLWVMSGVDREDMPTRRQAYMRLNAMKIGHAAWPSIISTADSILDETWAMDAENSATDTTNDPIDGHRAMNTLKIAVALAILDGRQEVVVEDWELAKHVMDRSDEVRGEAIEAEHAAAAEEAAKKGVERAMSDKAALGFDVRVNTFVARALEKGFLRGAKPVGPPWRAFRAMFGSKDRGLYMEAVMKEMQWTE